MVAVSLGLGRQADVLSHSALDAVEKVPLIVSGAN